MCENASTVSCFLAPINKHHITITITTTMPFATKPDGEFNVYNVRYAPFIMECGFTETYSDVLADVISWLTQTDEAVRVVLLIKLIEKKTALIPPPLSIDSWIEDDNTPKEPFPDDPAYEYLRESTMLDVWVGPLEGFAELWRLKPGGFVERDGDRVVSLRVVWVKGTN